MFSMPDVARCRQFADYVVDNYFVAEDSDFRRDYGRMHLI